MQKPADSTLSDVVAQCMKDPAFFRRLRKNPAATLGRAQIRLSKTDRATLNRMLRSVPKGKTARALKLVRAFQANDPEDWRPGWPMGWSPE